MMMMHRTMLLILALTIALAAPATFADEPTHGTEGSDIAGDATTAPPAPSVTEASAAPTAARRVLEAEAAALGGPPLSVNQWIQVKTATTDFTPRLDGPGWYPLFKNTSTWPEKLEAGAVVPDYRQMLVEPAPHRGKLFLIEGYFIRARPMDNLLRREDYTQSVEEWAIKLSKDSPLTVLVYLTDPPEAPDVRGNRVGPKVRLAARFYKVWVAPDENRGNQPTNYLTFVGRSAMLIDEGRGGAGFGGGVSSRTAITVGLILLAVLGAFIFVLRRASRMSFTPKPLASRRGSVRERLGLNDEALDDNADETPGDPLPEDPSEALAELDRRRESDDKPTSSS